MKWMAGVVLAAGTVIVMATPAAAQFTNCMTGPAGMTTCNTVPNYGAMPPPTVRGGSVGDTVGFFHALHMRAENKKVGGLIADGKCDEARKEALRDGDLDLAEHVQKLCATTPP